jgi:hypothetical protein
MQSGRHVQFYSSECHLDSIRFHQNPGTCLPIHRHIPEHNNLHSHCYGQLTSHLKIFLDSSASAVVLCFSHYLEVDVLKYFTYLPPLMFINKWDLMVACVGCELLKIIIPSYKNFSALQVPYWSYTIVIFMQTSILFLLYRGESETFHSDLF